MEEYFVLVLVIVTSVGMCLVGGKGMGLSVAGLRIAAGKMLACLGLTLAFFAINLAVGMAAVLLGRVLTRGFVSLYYANDAVLLVLSFLQAIIFQRWRETRTARPPSHTPS
jgi:hypothetical protein